MKTKIISLILAFIMLICYMPTTPVLALAGEKNVSEVINYHENFSLNELDESDVFWTLYYFSLTILSATFTKSSSLAIAEILNSTVPS